MEVRDDGLLVVTDCLFEVTEAKYDSDGTGDLRTAGTDTSNLRRVEFRYADHLVRVGRANDRRYGPAAVDTVALRASHRKARPA